MAKFCPRMEVADTFAHVTILKFIYSEKVTKFCEIFNLLLNDTTQEKCKVKILQNFVAFSEYMNPYLN